MNEPQPLLPYMEVAQVPKIESFHAEAARGGLIISGPCPRCTHEMQFAVMRGVYRQGVFNITDAPSPQKNQIVTMLCTCGQPHPGRPSGEVGCGAYWNIEVGG